MITEATVGEVIKSTFPYLKNRFGLLNEELEHYSSNAFTPYLIRKYNSLNESTSQLFRNKGYKINELYVPLTIQEPEEESNFRIDDFPDELFQKDTKILVKDSAGMGKSTILKMIYRYAFDSHKIAFYIDLKSLINNGEVLAVEDYLQHELPDFKKDISKEFLLKLFSENKFYFMFDGADEVPDKYKEALFLKVISFCEKLKNSFFIVATREEDSVLSSFHSFKSYSINALEKEEAYELLRKYEFKDVKAEFLIEELEKGKNRPVLEFLKNPLLTTLLYTAYTYKKKIPLKKNLFYSQVFSALYENHDATKIGYLTRKKHSGLDIDDFEKILSHLAFNSRVLEELEYTRTELLKKLTKIAESHPTIEFTPSSFIKDLTTSVPVFRKDGNSYIWQHKSIQEYFYVRFLDLVLNDEQKKKVVSNILEQDDLKKYRFILDILFDEDEEFFHNFITRDVLKFTKKTMDECEYNLQEAALNVFYKYSSNLSVNIQDKDNKTIDILFDDIQDTIQKDYSIPEQYSSQAMKFSLGEKNRATVSLIFSHSYVTILMILCEKNCSFVKEYTCEHENIEESVSVSNLEKKGDLSELMKLGLRADVYILDIKGCESYLIDLDKKLSERDRLLVF